jgi:hypothetical protein
VTVIDRSNADRTEAMASLFSRIVAVEFACT